MAKVTGSRMGGNGATANIIANDSFEKRVGSKIQPQPNGCWYYDGRGDQYGHVSTVINGKQYRDMAHRVVYEILVGPVPEDHHIHHMCEMKGCVNPAHLLALTPSEHLSLHAELRRAS